MALIKFHRMGIVIFQLQVLSFSIVCCKIPYTTFVMNTSVAQNVTPCFSGSIYIDSIFNESSTWSEAEYSCKQMNYTGLITTPVGWKQWYHVRDVLQNAGFPENVTLWEGHFRPYFHVAEWYKLSGDNCEEDSTNVVSGENQFQQCVAVQWETYSQPHRLIAKNCSEMLPYVCHKNEGLAYFLLYNGFVFGPHNISQIEYRDNETINIFDDCAETCRDEVSCISFTFNHTSSNCTMTFILYGFGPVTYEIIPGYNNITHGVKTGCSVSVGNTPRNFSVTGVDPTLPSCGLSPIPANYCQIVPSNIRNVTLNGTELEQIVKELIDNLTIDADSTSSQQRKHKSVSDPRPSATFFGAVAAIVLTVVISLPVLLDILTFYWQFKNQGKNGRSKKGKKRNDPRKQNLDT